MKRFHYALMDLIAGNDGHVQCTDGSSFDQVAYSRFKYGWTPPAVEYAKELAALISDELWEENDGRPIYIVSAPYKFLPTASHAVALHLLGELRLSALERGVEAPMLLPFHKSRVGSSKYAQSSHEYRLKSLATLGLTIDESRVRDSVMVVVDDIRITGSAERATASFLEALSPHAVWYLHVARLDESLAMAHPGLEDELNQTSSHSLREILKDVMEGEFSLNTRVLRHMLESPPLALRWFVQLAPAELLVQMRQAADGNGADYCLRYPATLQELDNELSWRSRRSQPVPIVSSAS